MTAADVQQLFLERLGLRIGPETSAYVLRTWQAGAEGISVIASDARTGVAVHRLVATEELAAAPMPDAAAPFVAIRGGHPLVHFIGVERGDDRDEQDDNPRGPLR